MYISSFFHQERLSSIILGHFRSFYDILNYVKYIYEIIHICTAVVDESEV